MPVQLPAISKLDVCCETQQGPTSLWRVELRDLARGFCGGLVVALPLLYTLEMWTQSRVASQPNLMIILAAAYFINVTACYFCGYKGERPRTQPWFDALTTMGIGAVAALVTLVLIGRLGFGTSPAVLVNLVTLELIPVSLGASLAMNQLGGGGGCEEDGPDWGSADLRTVLATIVGSLLFAFNVAPTIEPKIILTTVSWWHILGIAGFSLFVSWLMVDFAHFAGRSENRGRFFRDVWVETVFSYFVSLLVSAALLWAFGYINFFTTDWMTILPWVVVLGYATTLGGSAGRLLL